MDIILRTNKDASSEQLNHLTQSVGWGKRSDAAWKKIKKSSSLFLTAWVDNELVGMGRIVEDGTMCMVYDIIVLPQYQGQKISSQIMSRIKEEISRGNYQSVGLFAWNKNSLNIPFYKKFGFQPVDFGMKLNLV